MDSSDFTRAERRRLRRLERRLDRAARRHPSSYQPEARGGPARRASVGTVVSLAITGLVLVLAVSLIPGSTTASIRALVGLGNDPLGAPPDALAGDGSYAFLQTQRGSEVPVSWSACRPIRVEVNPEDAPPGHLDLVETAMERTGKATGFRFELVGTTDSREFRPRVSMTGTAPPVLVAWADGEEYDALAGEVAGVGGGLAIAAASGRLEYVTGAVVLDEDVFTRLVVQHDLAQAQAIVDHEFGHLVGLDHVDDPGELMHHDNVGRTSYGPGDREGLARLGRVPCG